MCTIMQLCRRKKNCKYTCIKCKIIYQQCIHLTWPDVIYYKPVAPGEPGEPTRPGKPLCPGGPGEPGEPGVPDLPVAPGNPTPGCPGEPLNNK